MLEIAGTRYNDKNSWYWFFDKSPEDLGFFGEKSVPEIDLSLVADDKSWVTVLAPKIVSTGDRLVFGWRYQDPTAKGSLPSYYYGWSKVEIGSTTHVESFVNNTPNGAITLGLGAASVPEPATFMTVALAGLFVFRRRGARG